MRLRNRGFTIVELMVVVAIIGVLAAILYASLGGVREKARQAGCMSNLRQIGQALAMYRDDYSGSDTPASPYEMGFPGSPFLLIRTSDSSGKPYLKAGEALFHCPNSPMFGGIGSRCDYNYQIWNPGEFVGNTPPFAEAIAIRGDDFPIFVDMWHDTLVSPQDRPHSTMFFLVLRLNGRVVALHAARTDGWKL